MGSGGGGALDSGIVLFGSSEVAPVGSCAGGLVVVGPPPPDFVVLVSAPPGPGTGHGIDHGGSPVGLADVIVDDVVGSLAKGGGVQADVVTGPCGGSGGPLVGLGGRDVGSWTGGRDVGLWTGGEGGIGDETAPVLVVVGCAGGSCVVGSFTGGGGGTGFQGPSVGDGRRLVDVVVALGGGRSVVGGCQGLIGPGGLLGPSGSSGSPGLPGPFVDVGWVSVGFVGNSIGFVGDSV